jgi:hypothetical protein
VRDVRHPLRAHRPYLLITVIPYHTQPIPLPMKPIILPDHIRRPSGSMKTVCVTACLTALGIPVDAFQSTSTRKNVTAYHGVIRRHGFALRSRKSSIPRNASVGRARRAIASFNDPIGTVYIVRVQGHLLLVDDRGATIVDTSPRQRDRRQVVEIHAVWSK